MRRVSTTGATPAFQRIEYQHSGLSSTHALDGVHQQGGGVQVAVRLAPHSQGGIANLTKPLQARGSGRYFSQHRRTEQMSGTMLPIPAMQKTNQVLQSRKDRVLETPRLEGSYLSQLLARRGK